jgi:para-aminobenzoate synthetase component 1
VLAGGTAAKEAGPGYFIKPTVVANVSEKARIAREEIFGPVLAVIKAKDFDDALRIANGTDYGLTGAVYTNRKERIERAERDFHAGNLYVNRKCTGAMVGVHPFGGFNMSGTDSKAGGRDYLLLFLQAKTISERVALPSPAPRRPGFRSACRRAGRASSRRVPWRQDRRRPVATVAPATSPPISRASSRLPFLIDWNEPGISDRGWTPINQPFRVLIAYGERLTEWRDGKPRTWDGDPFAAIEAALKEHAVNPADAEDLPFAGAAVGYLGYDLGSRLEKLPRLARDDRGFPDLVLAFHDRALAIDHRTGFAQLVETNPRAPTRAIRPEDYAKHFDEPPPLPLWTAERPVVSNFRREEYLKAIGQAREYIAAGDIYQVNLSQRFHTRSRLSPLGIYERLRASSPSPYSALLEMGERSLISSSPELFLQTEGRRVVTRPIKGTRPRGATPADDERLRAELLASPKDDAELAMIVDLERNDVGRVCEAGSVKVIEPKTLETHPTVHHLSATIEGTLKPGAGPVDLLRATFPGGSVTGAPKIRAMEIIDELEPTRRAAYTGAIGRIGFDGRVALSVAIRTVEKNGEDVWFQAVGGLVADSDPEREFDETIVKASGIVRALGLDLAP